MVPAPLRWIVERLLAKDPAERYDSSRDLYRELKQLRDRLTDTTAPVSGITAAAGPAAVPRSHTRRWLAVVALLAVAGAASALTWALVPRNRAGEVDLAAYRFTPISLEAPTEREPVWSPDGRSLAYLASIDGVQQLMIREVGAVNGVQLTQGGSPCVLLSGTRRVARVPPARSRACAVVGECRGRRTRGGDRRGDLRRASSARWPFRHRSRWPLVDTRPVVGRRRQWWLAMVAMTRSRSGSRRSRALPTSARFHPTVRSLRS